MSEDKVRIVPVEPTPGMTFAAQKKRPFYTERDYGIVYKAMLAAAPASDCVPVKREWIEAILSSRAPDAIVAEHGGEKGDAIVRGLRALLGGEHG